MTRLYSLYQRKLNGRNWDRVSMLKLPKTKATYVYQNVLLQSVFDGWRELRVRPCKDEQVELLDKGT